MKKRVLLSLIFILSSCTNSLSSSFNSESISNSNEFNPYYYIKSLNFEGLNEKLDNKEDFICVLTSSYCGYCQSIKNDIFNYMKSAPYDVYIYELDQMFENLETNNLDVPIHGQEVYEASKVEYRYLASCLEKVGDYVIGEEGGYMRQNYTNRFGIKEASVIYPSTLLYIDGELLIEFSYIGYGWSSNVDNYSAFINNFINLTRF